MRWSTYATLINSISKNENCLKSAVWDARILSIQALSHNAKKIQTLVCNNEDFWDQVNMVKEILTPFSEAITKIEGSEINPRVSYKSIKNAFEVAFQAIQLFPEFLQQQLIEVTFK